jgi:GDP-L-fucose synthase
MRILVLGGHGFIGKNLAQALEKKGDDIFSLSRRDGLDLLDAKLTRKYFAKVKPDAIFNCAAHAGSLHYVTKNAASVAHDNMQMALNLYEAAHQICPSVRIINPLSNCSYPGDADIHYEPDWWKGEVHYSVYAYGNSKRMLYVLSHCYKMQYGMNSFNFLIPNTFGPGDYADPNRTHALNGMIIRMIKAHRERKSEFEIWGTGKPIREWAYIEDVVKILKRALVLQKDLTYPVNIAQNKGYSIRGSAELIAKGIGYRGKLVYNTDYQDGAPKKVLDNRRFRGLFPDYKFINHEEAIRRTIRYYESVLR